MLPSGLDPLMASICRPDPPLFHMLGGLQRGLLSAAPSKDSHDPPLHGSWEQPLRLVWISGAAGSITARWKGMRLPRAMAGTSPLASSAASGSTSEQPLELP